MDLGCEPEVQIGEDREAWRATVRGVAKGGTYRVMEQQQPVMCRQDWRRLWES